jgi:hypothetical protein
MTKAHGYRVLAHTFRVDAPRDLAAFLRRFLAPFEAEIAAGASSYRLRHEPDAERPWVIDLDGAPLHRSRTSSRILEFALWDISTKAIASDHGCLAVHAAAASRRGAGIVMPAPPESGKSTLVAGLIRAGCAYLTDEAALIDPATLLVQPFPRSLWLTRPSIRAVFQEGAEQLTWSTGRQFHVRPADLRPRAVGRPCPVRVVVAPSYRAGAETAIEPMGRAEAVVVLAENAFHLDRFGGEGIELLGRVAAGADCYRLVIGDLPSAVAAVLAVVDGAVPVGAR